MVEVSRIDRFGNGGTFGNDHFQTGFTETGDACSRNFGVGVFDPDHYPDNPCADDCFDTRRGPTLVCARFETDIHLRTMGGISSSSQGDHLCMICSGTFVKALTYDRAVLDHHGADSRVGMGAVSGRKLERPLQPGTVEQIHLAQAPVNPIGGAWLLLGELFHLNRHGRCLPLCAHIADFG
jgi:hypothetical protein